jgi:hypothetical protein
MATTNQLVTAGSVDVIDFLDSVTGGVDKNGDWDNTLNRFTVTTASGDGTYQFEVSLFCSSSSTSYFNLQAFVNGTIKAPNGKFASTDAVASSTWDGITGVVSLDLEVGDYVDIKMEAFGGTITISNVGSWNGNQGMRISKTSGVKGEKGDTGAGTLDPDAIHDNVANEITAITAKTAPANADELLIEDSAASFVKKAVTVGDLRKTRITSTASTATLTVDSSITDQSILTAQAAALTIASPTGGPEDGQKLIIRLKDNATARAITWNAIFRAMGTTLPTTTVISKTVYIGCIYNSTDTKWDVVSVAQEA